jgi:hypothetical protein
MRFTLVHYLILGVVVFFLYLMFFGGSSIEKKRKEMQAKKTKTLVEKIVKAANKKKKGGSSNDIPKGMAHGGDTSADIEEGVAIQKATKPSIDGRPSISDVVGNGSAPSMTIPGGSKPMQNPYLTGAAKAKPQTDPANMNNNNDSYYPPQPQKMQNRGKPTSSNGVTDKSMQAAFDPDKIFSPGYGFSASPVGKGKKAPGPGSKTSSLHMAFEGTQAFMLDENKNPVPVPDGYYRIGDTDALIMIMGGHKYIPH